MKKKGTFFRNEDPDSVGSVDCGPPDPDPDPTCNYRLNKFKHKMMVYNTEFYTYLPKKDEYIFFLMSI